MPPHKRIVRHMDLSTLVQQFQAHPFLLFFLAALIGGEEIMIPLAFMVGTGLWDFKTLLIACFLGTLVSDTLWFLLGRHGLQKTKLFKKHEDKYKKVVEFLNKISKNNFIVLLVTKFLYGTRIFTILHFGVSKISKSKFLLMNSVVIMVWLPIALGIGWFAGKGSSLFLGIYTHPIWFFTGVGFIILFYHFIRNQIARHVLPKNLQ